MRKLLASISVISLLLLLWGCPNGIKKTHYNYNAYFPEQAVNLTDVNSIYDDYNSTLHQYEYHFGRHLTFSSNRHTAGYDFDLVNDNFYAIWYMETGELTVNNDQLSYNQYIPQMLAKVNWEGNEFAPYAIGFDTVIDSIHKRINLLAYSTNNDCYTYHEEFVYHESEDGSETGTSYGAFTISNLSNKRQQYISFYGEGVTMLDSWVLNPNLFTQMYFDADDDGSADIYKIEIPHAMSFMQFLNDTIVREKNKIEELSTASDDRCPFINGNFIVFTSDKPGGYGGYDLYYSFYNGSEWAEPVNFGEDINTAYDEFRPVAVQVYEFKNDLMIFSSNRPGGMGGFDLYYVGIDKISPTIIAD